MKTTKYFEQNVLQKRPDIKENWCEWCQQVIANPIKVEVQADGRIRYWGEIPEKGKVLRVVTLEDKQTIHNAFFDRSFLRKYKQEPENL
jgi:hypothetical protein